MVDSIEGLLPSLGRFWCLAHLPYAMLGLEVRQITPFQLEKLLIAHHLMVIRKNGHVVIKGRPCKIVDMSTSKTGKHGHAKVHLVAIDVSLYPFLFVRDLSLLLIDLYW